MPSVGKKACLRQVGISGLKPRFELGALPRPKGTVFLDWFINKGFTELQA
jgi:hypothetical protein